MVATIEELRVEVTELRLEILNMKMDALKAKVRDGSMASTSQPSKPSSKPVSNVPTPVGKRTHTGVIPNALSTQLAIMTRAGKQPTLTDLAFEVMVVGTSYTVPQIAALMQATGRQTAAKNLINFASKSVSELWHAGSIERVSRGQYRRNA